MHLSHAGENEATPFSGTTADSSYRPVVTLLFCNAHDRRGAQAGHMLLAKPTKGGWLHDCATLEHRALWLTAIYGQTDDCGLSSACCSLQVGYDVCLPIVSHS
jgi:hypothetical protein